MKGKQKTFKTRDEAAGKGKRDPRRWRELNPGYQPSGPRKFRINGVEVVEIDGGSVADCALMYRELGIEP